MNFRSPHFLVALLGSLLLWAACTPAPEPVEEISAQHDSLDATTYLPPAEDWPWWRGPDRNGVALSDSAPVKFSETENLIWKTEIPGRGHSSPTVSGNHIFLATADDDQQQQIIMALDRQSGEVQWSTVVNEGGFPTSSGMHHKSTHANGTLAVNGEAIFGAFLHSNTDDRNAIHAYALDYEGNLLWEQELGAFEPKFGYAPSPVIYKSMVIFAADFQASGNVGGYLTAVDQASGEFIWRKSRPAAASYSSPVVANVAGTDQLLISGCNMLASYDPVTGEQNWSCEGTATGTCGTPVWAGDLVMASGGYPQRNTLCVDANTGQEVWSNSTKCYEQSMLVAEGYLYSFTDDGIVYCWDTITGQEQWKQRLGGPVSASPVLCNGNIYLANERGAFTVIKANPAAYEVVAENQLGDEVFASPVICDGRLFLRVGYQDKPDVLYCFGEEKSR